MPFDDFAIEAARESLRMSAATGYRTPEHCGLICCKEGQYKRTGPYPGRKTKDGAVCDPAQEGGCSQFGQGWKEVAGYHSHPPGNLGGAPSTLDRRWLDQRNRPEYIALPPEDGNVVRGDPDPGYDRNIDWEYESNGGQGGGAVFGPDNNLIYYVPPTQ
jgi:proteasome lid subunit RPN8/RPN11